MNDEELKLVDKLLKDGLMTLFERQTIPVVMKELKRAAIRQELIKQRGNQSKAGLVLGINRKTINEYS